MSRPWSVIAQGWRVTDVIHQTSSPLAGYEPRWIVGWLCTYVRDQKGRSEEDLYPRKRIASVSSPCLVDRASTTSVLISIDIVCRFWEGAEILSTQYNTAGKAMLSAPENAGESAMVH